MRLMHYIAAIGAAILISAILIANWYDYHVLQPGENDAAYFERGWELASQPAPNYLVLRRPRLRI